MVIQLQIKMVFAENTDSLINTILNSNINFLVEFMEIRIKDYLHFASRWSQAIASSASSNTGEVLPSCQFFSALRIAPFKYLLGSSARLKVTVLLFINCLIQAFKRELKLNPNSLATF